MHAVGAAAQLAGRLGAAQQQLGQNGSLMLREVIRFLQAMLVFAHAADHVVGRPGQPLFLQAAQGVAHRVFVQGHHRIAIGFLVAGVDQRIQGKRIIFGCGELLSTSEPSTRVYFAQKEAYSREGIIQHARHSRTAYGFAADSSR